mmetsp:Transcript_57075/g.121275  ORF Transcript_57075/g.121275 Transcript_57075/m.121275 type:complete len:381 (+) Transcript_57075:160-1302(+)|eukprot:CAMPEP_0206445554 /NCGR_PEP_ID=MMETSP0324_2-20121206/15589_1 /ASSEMBLY_ACC=CAM_ASM_000836 /TAXON_ID=2866 /ORGANISM="Crypthecodinium cohnii, Strain Seligo" /LENGTH=380 /DNA_ID=CAMNT_0053913815 /DNA_START=158 /DNA_END=1300 /DNA_ORIENTATION=+
MNVEEALTNLHEDLYDWIEDAVASVAEWESRWSESELTKRVHGYVYKACQRSLERAPPDLKRWEEFLGDFVNTALGSFSASCSDRKWYFQFPLGDPLKRASRAILPMWSKGRITGRRETDEFVEGEYMRFMNHAFFDKTLWLAVGVAFKGVEYNLQGKIVFALSKSYTDAQNSLKEEDAALEAKEKIIRFTKSWITGGLDRMWNCLHTHPTLLRAEACTQLFQEVIRPDRSYSTLPPELTNKTGGPPPKNWTYIGQVVDGVFNQWNRYLKSYMRDERRKTEKRTRRSRSPRGGRPKKERSRSASEVSLNAEEEPEAPIGHPKCTMEEECRGKPDDRLVWHKLPDGTRGDPYCRTCWDDIREKNVAEDLEGEEEDFEDIEP